AACWWASLDRTGTHATSSRFVRRLYSTKPRLSCSSRRSTRRSPIARSSPDHRAQLLVEPVFRQSSLVDQHADTGTLWQREPAVANGDGFRQQPAGRIEKRSKLGGTLRQGAISAVEVRRRHRAEIAVALASADWHDSV